MHKSATPCNDPKPMTHVSFNDVRETVCANCGFQLFHESASSGKAHWVHLPRPAAPISKV